MRMLNVVSGGKMLFDLDDAVSADAHDIVINGPRLDRVVKVKGRVIGPAVAKRYPLVEARARKQAYENGRKQAIEQIHARTQAQDDQKAMMDGFAFVKEQASADQIMSEAIERRRNLWRSPHA